MNENVSVEEVNGRWVGTYRCPQGRIAVVTQEAFTEPQAREAAARWVVAPGAPGAAYYWEPSRRYPGRYDVIENDALGPKPVPREPVYSA